MSMNALLKDNSISWSVRVTVGMGEFLVGPFSTKPAARLWIKEARKVADKDTKFTPIAGFAPKEQ